MSKAILSKRKSDAIANGVFLIAIGILFYTNTWWPGILLAIWASLAVRQYFSGRLYDLIISTVIIVGLFLITLFRIDWSLLAPILFVVGGAYIIFREYFFADESSKEGKSKGSKNDVDN